MLRWLLWIVGGLVVLLIVAVFAVPPLTGGMIADRITNTIEQETGRTATVSEVSWSLLPSPSARIAGLTIANMPDGAADIFVSLESAEIDVALFPLIGGGIEVENISVSNLTVALEEAEDGTANWEFGESGVVESEPSESDSDRGPDGTSGGSGFGAIVDRLDISGVSVTYRRLTDPEPSIVLSDGGLTGSLDAEGALDLDGSASVNGQPVELTVHADRVQDLMSGQGTLEASFDSPVATARIDGGQSGGGFSGTVDIQVPSIDAVAEFLALPADQRPPFEQFSLMADLAGSADGVQVDNIQLAIDDATVVGAVSFTPGPPQHVTAQLQAAGFDLAVLPTAGAGPIDRIAGLVDMEIDVEATGNDADEMQQTLDGTINVTVANGLVHVQRPDGSRAELEQLAASFSMVGRQSGTDLSMSGLLNGRNFSVDGTVGSVDAVAAGPVPMNFSLTSDAANISFDGQADVVGQAGDGTLDVSIPSVAALMSWLGAPVGDLPVDSISINGDVSAQGESVGLSNLSFAFDDLTGTADLTASSTPIPTLNGSVALGRVDIDALSGGGSGSGSSGSAGAASGGSAASSGGSSGAAPVTEGDASRFGVLNEVAVDLNMSAEALTYSGVVTGPTSIDLDIQNGALSLVIADTPVNNGSIGGSFTANAADSSIGVNVSVAGVAARPFLASFADIDWLSGTATIDAALTGSGDTRSAILSTLNGTGSFAFQDGSVEGINIAGVLRDPLQAISNPSMLETLSTDFAELSATTTITNGIASTNDLLMLAPIFRMTGEGAAGLPSSSLDFLLVPTLVATLEGQGGQVQDGLAIPIRVTGPFDDPQYRLEINPATIQGFIENPQGAIDAIRGLAGEGGELPSLENLLPGADGQGGDAQNLLEGLGRGLLGN
ncbi:MAG: AsmA family protein [Pseudomonadota bacterium]